MPGTHEPHAAPELLWSCTLAPTPGRRRDGRRGTPDP